MKKHFCKISQFRESTGRLNYFKNIFIIFFVNYIRVVLVASTHALAQALGHRCDDRFNEVRL